LFRRQDLVKAKESKRGGRVPFGEAYKEEKKMGGNGGDVGGGRQNADFGQFGRKVGGAGVPDGKKRGKGGGLGVPWAGGKVRPR